VFSKVGLQSPATETSRGLDLFCMDATECLGNPNPNVIGPIFINSELDRVAVRIRRHAGTHLESVVRGELYRCAELDSSSFDQLRVQNRRSLKQACTALH